MREAALPALRSLAEDIGATAHLTLVDGADALAVAVVEPTWTDYHVAYRPGFRHPLDQGAAGRAILSARQRTVVDHPGYTLTQGSWRRAPAGPRRRWSVSREWRGAWAWSCSRTPFPTGSAHASWTRPARWPTPCAEREPTTAHY